MLTDIRGFVFDFDGTLAIPNIDFALMRRQVDAIALGFGIDPTPFKHLYILEMIERVARVAARVLPAVWIRPYGHDRGFADDHLHLDIGYVRLTPRGHDEDPPR